MFWVKQEKQEKYEMEQNMEGPLALQTVPAPVQIVNSHF